MKKSLVLILLLLICGCSTNENATENTTINLGTVNNYIYSNDFFNIELGLNNEWYLLSNEEQEALTNTGLENYSKNNDSLKKQLELSEEVNVNLLFLSKYPVQYEQFNPKLLIVATNLDYYKQIKTASQFLQAQKESYEILGVQFESISDTHEETIGEYKFSQLEHVTYSADQLYTQRHYATIKDGYALSFIMTYTNEIEFRELDNMLKTIIFL